MQEHSFQRDSKASEVSVPEAEKDAPGATMPNRFLAVLRPWPCLGVPGAALMLAGAAFAGSAQSVTSQIERGACVARAAGCMSFRSHFGNTYAAPITPAEVTELRPPEGRK